MFSYTARIKKLWHETKKKKCFEDNQKEHVFFHVVSLP